MAREPRQDEPAPQRRRARDSRSDLLKDGGMQIVAVAVACVATVVLVALWLLWMWLSTSFTGPAAR